MQRIEWLGNYFWLGDQGRPFEVNDVWANTWCEGFKHVKLPGKGNRKSILSGKKTLCIQFYKKKKMNKSNYKWPQWNAVVPGAEWSRGN